MGLEDRFEDGNKWQLVQKKRRYINIDSFIDIDIYIYIAVGVKSCDRPYRRILKEMKQFSVWKTVQKVAYA